MSTGKKILPFWRILLPSCSESDIPNSGLTSPEDNDDDDDENDDDDDDDDDNNNNNNNNKLQMGCHPVAVIIMHVHK